MLEVRGEHEGRNDDAVREPVAREYDSAINTVLERERVALKDGRIPANIFVCYRHHGAHHGGRWRWRDYNWVRDVMLDGKMEVPAAALLVRRRDR